MPSRVIVELSDEAVAALGLTEPAGPAGFVERAASSALAAALGPDAPTGMVTVEFIAGHPEPGIAKWVRFTDGEGASVELRPDPWDEAAWAAHHDRPGERQ